MDWSVGRVLDTLRALRLDRNTLVLFTSDNGPWLIKGADGGSAGPLRGGKGSTWEGGVRVPTLAWWPGRIPPGTVSDAVAGTIDVLPTCVALAGGQVPAEPVIDGRDISPLLFGRSTASAREAHYYFAGYNLQAVRQGPWKLAIAPQPEGMGRDAAKDSAAARPRLYNLEAEIGERTNVADQHPDLVAKLLALAAKTAAEIGGNKPAARRPAGEVANPQPLYPMEIADPGGKANLVNAKPVPLDTLKPGDTLRGGAAPQVAHRAFTISCTIETAQTDAVLLAHGGLSAGYALHLKGSRIAFAVRTGAGDAITEITTPAPVLQPARITAALAADATMTLTVNGTSVTGKAPRLIPRQPAESFCLGHDDGRPVGVYTAKEPFRGSLRELKLASP
jgi:hypothetical protein